MPSARLAAYLLVALALAPSAHMALRHRDLPQLGLLLDDAVYVASARSLAGGEYNLTGLPHQPHQVKYPPGYPALLAVAWKWSAGFPDNLPAMVLLTWSCFVATCFLTVRVAETFGMSPWERCVVAVLVALNPYASFYATNLMSEIPFLALVGLCALAVHAAAHGKLWLSCAAGALAGLAYLVRGSGIVLLPAGMLFLGVRRSGRAPLWFAVGMIPFIAGWSWWVNAHRVEYSDYPLAFFGDYFGHYLATTRLSDLPAILDRNFQTLLVSIGRLLWFDLGESLGSMYAKSLLSIIGVAGVVMLARRGSMSFYHWFAALSVPLLLIWNHPPNERFVLPLLPLLIGGFVISVRAILGEAARVLPAGRIIAVLAGVCATVLMLRDTAAAHREYFPAIVERERQRHHDQRAIYEKIRAQLPANASAMAFQETRLHLYTGVRALGMPLPPGLIYHGTPETKFAYFATLKDVARRHGIEYYFHTPWDFAFDLDEEQRAQWRTRVASDPELEPVIRSGDLVLFHIRGAR